MAEDLRQRLLTRRLRPPLFVNCAIQDPFWWEEPETGDDGKHG